ncbi:MAG TPA: FtsW/RodA/SpoVE family cell cycle protein, partial [Saprospiraceae bacterium]|nr:FtsW/RodA/SpoVE family cell cycle protein [Saprospiraceae bacterium]
MSKVFVRIYNGNLGDRMIWFILLILAMVSALAVYSTSGSLAYKHDSSALWYLMQHVVFILLGFVLTYICAMMNYMKFSKIAPVLLIIAGVLLVYTLFFGSTINDARRWIRIPIINVTFQTSDFAKLALVIYLARILTTKQETIKDFKSAFIPIIAPVGIICFLIAPVNLSTAMLLFLTCLSMMFVGRVKSKYMFGMIGIGALLFGVLVLTWYFFPEHVRVGTWINRIQDFMGTGDGSFQNVQAKIAIANGGVFGVGAGDGGQIHFLPSAYADFIYASICEEYGIIGAVLIMGLFVLFFVRVVKIVTNSPKAFGALLAMGLALL